MAMLDEGFEISRGSGSGPFSCEDLIDTTGREVHHDLELVTFVDTERLCDSISETAACLSQKDLHPRLRAIEELGLDERLKELNDELTKAAAVKVVFSRRMTMYSSAYNNLLATYGQDTDSGDTHSVLIPGEKIHAVTTLPGKESESSFRPRAILRVLTGLETPLTVLKDGKLVEEPGPARWFEFPLERSEIRTLGLPTK